MNDRTPRVTVHDTNFEPPRRGRTPLVRIEGLINAAADYPGQWVSKDYEERVANSVVRQIKTKYDLGSVEVCSLRNDDKTRTVYVRVSTTGDN